MHLKLFRRFSELLRRWGAGTECRRLPAELCLLLVVGILIEPPGPTSIRKTSLAESGTPPLPIPSCKFTDPAQRLCKDSRSRGSGRRGDLRKLATCHGRACSSLRLHLSKHLITARPALSWISKQCTRELRMVHFELQQSRQECDSNFAQHQDMIFMSNTVFSQMLSNSSEGNPRPPNCPSVSAETAKLYAAAGAACKGLRRDASATMTAELVAIKEEAPVNI